MTKLASVFSTLFFCVICFTISGCIDEKALQKMEQEKLQEKEKARQENLQEKKRVRKQPFDILTAESTRKKESDEINVRWVSNRDVPLDLDVYDKNDEGITYTIKPTCFENGHCVYDVTFNAPFGKNVYLTFYDPKGRIALEHTVHVPDLNSMVLSGEVF